MSSVSELVASSGEKQQYNMIEVVDYNSQLLKLTGLSLLDTLRLPPPWLQLLGLASFLARSSSRHVNMDIPKNIS